MFCKHEAFANRKRNTTNSYLLCVDRLMLEDEIKFLFEAQRKLGNKHASPVFEKQFLEVFAWQMPFAPGDSILSRVGSCTFIPEEKRAPRNSYTAERFILLSDINRLYWNSNGEKLQPTAEQRSQLLEMAYNQSEVTYRQIRKTFSLPEDARFPGLPYMRRKEGVMEESHDCEKRPFAKLNGYHEIHKLCKNAGDWNEIKSNPDMMDNLAYALTFYKTEEDTRAYLSERNVPTAIIDPACENAGFSKVTHLSIKAMREIIPFLEEGEVYSVACEKAGYDHSKQSDRGEPSLKLPVIDPDEVRNPVVLRALTQARKVVNAVIDRYSSPHQINIELAREIGKSTKEKKDIEKRIEENKSANQRDAEHFAEIFGQEARTGEDRLKWRLYREQGGRCAYSLEPIDLENRFFEPGYTEIDHILPYSRSFDDAISNKVLVLWSENQNKRNQTPFEYFGGNENRWAQYEAWVSQTIRDPKKRRNLLLREYGETERMEWIPRNLVDTQYIARFFSSFLRENLVFADKENKLPVVCVNGRAVSLFRGLWGLSKVREENDLHHALDAAVVAAMTPRMMTLITEYRKARETMRWKAGDTYVDTATGEVIDFKFAFPQPWKGFRKEIIARLSDDPAAEIADLGLGSYADKKDVKPVLVSRKPVRTVTGPLHMDTIHSAREVEGKRVSVARRDITSLKMADMDKLFAPETNEKLYAAIRERMEQFGGNAEKAFAEPLYKPTKDGSPGPIVKKVKVMETQPSGVEIRGGVAANAKIVRTDVFIKGGKYYLVPVYISDFMAGVLPNRAIAANKPWEEWPAMDDTCEFLFSLYPYDLIRIQTRKDEFFGYYRGTHRGTGALSISTPNKNDEMKEGIGARTAVLTEKYTVGVLGDYYKVKKEERRGLADGGDIEPGETEGRK